MKTGDKFIRYSKYGESAIKGTVARTWTTYAYDLKNKVRIKKEMIESTTGVKYEVKDCYEIESEISFNFLRKLAAIFSKKKDL
jgi:hypothetical protein